MIGVVYFLGGEIPAHPSRNRSELWDVATSTYTRWNADGSVAQTRPFNAAETAEAERVAKDAAAVTNRPVLETKAAQALATNATYLAQPAIPAGALTNTQRDQALRVIRAQVDALTKETNALIRLAIGRLDSVDGT